MATYPDPTQVSRTILLREIRDNQAAAQGYTNPDGSTVAGSNANTVGGALRTSQGGYFAPVVGAELPSRPAVTDGVRLELSSGASMTYYVAATGSTYNASPTYTKTLAVAGTTDEPLKGADTVFVTALTGTIIARWVQR